MNYFTTRNKCLGQLEKDKGQYDYLTGKTGYAHGAATLVKREALEKPEYLAKTFLFISKNLNCAKELKKRGTKFG